MKPCVEKEAEKLSSVILTTTCLSIMQTMETAGSLLSLLVACCIQTSCWVQSAKCTAKTNKKMVFYIEACYSGSMFIKKLQKDIGVYAVTAANDHESSWSCYYDEKRKTSLADSFSIKWMLDSEQHGTQHRTLAEQFQAVKSQVRLSHVCNFGDANGMGGMKLSEFQGSSSFAYSNFTVPEPTDYVRSWDVKYHSLLRQLEKATTTEERLDLLKEMEIEEKTKQDIEDSLKQIAVQLVSEPSYMFAATTKETTLLAEHCYESAVDAYTKACYQFQEYDYAMKDLHVFQNPCSAGVPIEYIYKSIEKVCSSPKKH